MRREAMLWKGLDNKYVQCALCAHRCRIAEGQFGFCGMRQNLGGKLYTFAYGSVIANHVDPIEKKPLYHFLPGSFSYSIATIGCNFRCGFCQNWTISQASVKDGNGEGYELKPEEIVREALKNDCRSISYTYTEPTVFFEYAYETSQLARKKGLYNNFVTNGYMTPEAIDAIAPFLNAANVDLKFFSEDSYKKICKGTLQPVLDSISYMRKKGIWVEVTTLVVPGLNDSDEELGDIAKFMASTDSSMPWHVSRFHPDYKFTDVGPTPVETLRKAKKIGLEAGVRYIYLGNVAADGDTICPGCGTAVIKRSGFGITHEPDISKEGKCRKCGAVIEGVWE